MRTDTPDTIAGLELLSPEGQAAAQQLATIARDRVATELQKSGGEYTAEGSQVGAAGAGAAAPDVDRDAVAVATRERLIRHGLDAIAGRLLPKSIMALDQILDGSHPDGKGATGAAKLVFEALRMTGAHVLDRDRTKGADALSVAELEDEIARASAALRRKLEADRVVSTVPAAPAGANPQR